MSNEDKMTQEKLVGLAKELGCSVKELKRVIAQEVYRREYNQRPKVKAARKEYNRKRNADMKAIRQALKEKPELAKELMG